MKRIPMHFSIFLAFVAAFVLARPGIIAAQGCGGPYIGTANGDSATLADMDTAVQFARDNQPAVVTDSCGQVVVSTQFEADPSLVLASTGFPQPPQAPAKAPLSVNEDVVALFAGVVIFAFVAFLIFGALLYRWLSNRKSKAQAAS